MKKTMKALVCFLIVFSMVLTLSGCEILGGLAMIAYSNIAYSNEQRYTGGFSRPIAYYHVADIYWIESFDDAMSAIEHLRAAGNDIPNTYISSYENDVVDAKYLFILDKQGMSKEEKQKTWYDRKYTVLVQISYYGFLDEVTVEELEYSYVELYRHVLLHGPRQKDYTPQNAAIVYEYKNEIDSAGVVKEYCYLITEKDEDHIGKIEFEKMEDHNAELPENFHEDFINSLVYIGD